MTRKIYRTLAIASGVVFLAGAALSENVTNQEREQALRYLDETRSGVLEAVKGLSDAQWNFKPAPDRWSIAEVLEHIVVVEGFLTNNIRARLETGPAPSAERDAKQLDATILEKIPDRSIKYKAPPEISPTGRWTPSATLDRFIATRQQTIEWLKSDTNLRAHTADHPVLGALDGYQWILLAATHSARHTKQILEVKADPKFPVN